MTRIVLADQGNSALIYESGRNLARTNDRLSKITVRLNWKLGVDLDIHAFYKLAKNKQNDHIYFGNKGKDSKLPYIFLDQDAGIGNVAGDNQEIITINTLAHVDCILIAANIFRFFGSLAKGESFSKYDGTVTIIPDNGNEIVVPLTSKSIGKWCIIAKIDNLDQNFPLVFNINDVTDIEPNIDDYILKDVLSLTYEDS